MCNIRPRAFTARDNFGAVLSANTFVGCAFKTDCIMSLTLQDKDDIIDATIHGVLEQLRTVVREEVAHHREENAPPSASRATESNTTPGLTNPTPAGKDKGIHVTIL